jgi:hypothetical protein
LTEDLIEMDDKAVDYHRGDMAIAEQAATFHGFIGLTKWGSLILAVAVLFLAMVFCAHAGFFQAAGAGVVVAVVGFLLLREKKSPAH